MSPEEFSIAIGEACKSMDGRIGAIENTLATHDYEANFHAKRIRKCIDGITECRELRVSAAADGSGKVVMHYKVCNDVGCVAYSLAMYARYYVMIDLTSS
jgi:hypothetical protein